MLTFACSAQAHLDTDLFSSARGRAPAMNGGEACDKRAGNRDRSVAGYPPRARQSRSSPQRPQPAHGLLRCAGGGFLIVPAPVPGLDFEMPAAAGTSLLVIAINSAAALLTRPGATASPAGRSWRSSPRGGRRFPHRPSRCLPRQSTEAHPLLRGGGWRAGCPIPRDRPSRRVELATLRHLATAVPWSGRGRLAGSGRQVPAGRANGGGRPRHRRPKTLPRAAGVARPWRQVSSPY